jgi:hypothetical protein
LCAQIFSDRENDFPGLSAYEPEIRLGRQTVAIRDETRNGHAARTLRQINERSRRRRISQDENEQAGDPKCGPAKKPSPRGVAIIVPDR